MVPEGWHMEMLKNIVDGGIKNGYSPNAAEKNTGHWVLGLGALGDNGLIASETKPVEATQKVLNCRLYPGDFLISRSNTPDKVGRSILFKGEIDNCSYPDLMMRFRVNEDIVDTGFIETKLKSFFVRGYFKNCSAGSSRTMVKINKPIVEKTPLLLPPLHEQKKIACILSIWDKAIETVEKLIENSKTQKKALMQQLLTGKQRLPGFEEKWEKTYLEDMTNITMGSSPNSDFYNDVGNGLPLIQGNADIKDRKSAPRIHTSKITKTCSKGDILLSVRAPVGAVAISMHDACIGRGIASISEKNKLPLSFVYQLLIAFESKWVQLSQGSTFDAVNSKDIKKLKIAIPLSKKEQQRIAVVLSTADKETKTLQQKLNCLKQEKNALMQQLLTGKRRVKVNVDG